MKKKLDPFGNPNSPVTATITAAAQSGNNRKITVQLQNCRGRDLGVRAGIGIYVSSNANGDDHASGLTIQNATTGILVGDDAVSDAAGLLVFDLNSTVAGNWYVVLVMADGSLVVSDVITFTGTTTTTTTTSTTTTTTTSAGTTTTTTSAGTTTTTTSAGTTSSTTTSSTTSSSTTSSTTM